MRRITSQTLKSLKIKFPGHLFEKVILLRFKEFHELHDDLQIIWKTSNPGRYHERHFGPTKKRRQCKCSIFIGISCIYLGCEPWVIDFSYFFCIYVVFGTDYGGVIYFLIRERLGCLLDSLTSQFCIFCTKVSKSPCIPMLTGLIFGPR